MSRMLRWWKKNWVISRIWQNSMPWVWTTSSLSTLTWKKASGYSTMLTALICYRKLMNMRTASVTRSTTFGLPVHHSRLLQEVVNKFSQLHSSHNYAALLVLNQQGLQLLQELLSSITHCLTLQWQPTKIWRKRDSTLNPLVMRRSPDLFRRFPSMKSWETKSKPLTQTTWNTLLCTNRIPQFVILTSLTRQWTMSSQRLILL